ncbi:hypothetical protein [Burkholderia vietnamiensis]|uniref:hypothetical protein n=1 Tax=Burkholderia vietnamiensis TaxID=60552 RepID=UPI001B91E5BA|nr:hypothetical protein [Burkholderia vietnamiensis]MBR7999225.1 hypothetical protein [Burkholderia vietnamiensis]
MTLASMSESMRNAFYRDLLERVATEPRPRLMPFVQVVPAAQRPRADRVCLSCGARESGGVLPCGH